jgi:NAD(P)-binding Rossmann-like domain
MADPFLLSHSCAPFQFTFAGPLTPVSIRDQMIRGRMFTDRAIEQAIISPSRRLLVTGAGAAGVTAAMRAAQLGVPVTLVEASHQAFGRQKSCTTRWVDPTQYDWPVDHWQQGIYPWTPPAMPLPWGAQRSSAIAAVWERELRRSLSRYGHLQLLLQSTLAAITHSAATKDLSVSLNTPSGPVSGVYGAALHCIGFGVERASVGKFSSFQFWDADPLEAPQLGLAPPPTPLRVLIGGGGDGALQDFLRITTGLRSAGALLNALPAHAQAKVTSAIQSAEDQSQRAGIWCERMHEHAVFARLHQIHLQQVYAVLTDAAVRQALQGSAATRARVGSASGVSLQSFLALLCFEPVYDLADP